MRVAPSLLIRGARRWWGQGACRETIVVLISSERTLGDASAGIMQPQDLTLDAAGNFDPSVYLATAGPGRTSTTYRPNKPVILQGDPTEALFYIVQGKVKLTYASDSGRSAVFAILGARELLGHVCVSGIAPHKFAVTTVTQCTITRLERATVKRLISEQPVFSEMFVLSLLRRVRWMQEDMINLLMNSSQKRLARVLLMLCRDQDNPDETLIPHISHEMLAEMVGTTRSRINNFMNEFRRRGFIDYNANGNLRVEPSLAQVLLRD
jgi:CRP/FNR family cyclic AMP-dependent transcriptional regulator